MRSRGWRSAVFRSLIAVGGSAMLLAACGSSHSSSAGNTASTGNTSTPASSQKEFVVGAICSCSGPNARSYGLSGKASSAWADWVNAHGGVNGYKVKLILMDDSSNPTTSTNEIKTLVEQDHVQAIVGDGSLVDSSWAAYIAGKGIPVIGGQPVDPPMYSNPDFYPIGVSNPNQFAGMMQLTQQLNKQHFGVMYCAEAAVCAGLVDLSKSASQIITGGKIKVSGVAVSATSPNYDAQCLALKSGGVDALTIGTSGPTLISITDQCSSLGFKPTQIGSLSVFSSPMLTDSNFEGSRWVSASPNYLDTSIPGVATFTQAITQSIPGVLASPEFNMTLLWQWAGGQLFAEAAKTGNLTPDSSPSDIKAALYKLNGTTLDGTSPPLTFCPGQPNVIRGYFTMQVNQGKLVGNTQASVTKAESDAMAKSAGLPTGC